MTTVNTDKKSAKRSFLIGLFFIALFGIFYLYSEYIDPAEIKSDYSLTTGMITEIGDIEMRNLKDPTLFEYDVNGKKYEGHFTNILPCNYDGFTSKDITSYNYTVIYSNKNPEKSRLLVTPEMFEEYDLSIDEDTRKIYSQFWDCE